MQDESRQERKARLQAERARRVIVYAGTLEGDADHVAYELRRKGIGARIVRRVVKAMGCEVEVFVVVRVD